MIKKFLPFLLIFNGLFFVSHTLSNDTWFLLNDGRYLTENGFPRTDPFTVHENLDVIMQQWLAALVFWKVYSLFGFAGLVVLVKIVGAAVLFGLFLLYLRAGGNFSPAVFLTMVMGALAGGIFFVDRPQIFSGLLFVLEVWLLIKYEEEGRRAFLFPLPFLSLLLINIHGAVWPLFFLFVLPFLVSSLRLRFLAKYFYFGGGSPKCLLIALFVSAAAGFMNPYGAEALVYGFNSYGDADIRFIIGEMKPLDVTNLVGAIGFALILAATVLCTRVKMPLHFVLLSLGTAYMSLSAVRNLYLFFLLGTLPFAYGLKDFRFDFLAGGFSRKKILAAAALVLCLSLLRLDTVRIDDGIKGAADYILAHEKAQDVRLLINYDIGGYMEFRGVKCYIDPRAEVFLQSNNHRKEIFHEYRVLFDGSLDYRQFLTRYDFNYALVTDCQALWFIEFAHDENFELVFEDKAKRYDEDMTVRLYKIKGAGK